ncbi:hypothetical protein [Chitinophaga flava]|uniref:Uncharacterized protein n=1 Tax=Chitinophaga flava TaxID=2259036 RepID=A0A365Y230_9BACT|nr:hypothetical protein [Chitinophaga flava]RBL91994.1 hypothetical protein DF182_05185 [Chitinophaga flava]
MSRKLSAWPLVVVIIITFFSCQKGAQVPSEPENPIEVAKSYFESNVVNLKRDQLNQSNKFGFDVNPIWERAKVKKIQSYETVIVPLVYTSRISTSSNGGQTKRIFRSYPFLSIFRNKSGKMTAEVVYEILSDNNPKEVFDGNIVVTDWEGNIKRSFLYNNGKVSRTQVSKSDRSVINETVTCTVTDYYQDVYIGGVYQGTTYLYTKTMCIDDGGGAPGGGGPVGGGDPDYGGGSSPDDSNIAPVVDAPPGDKIVNIKDYIKCFNSSSGAKVTIYVEQPKPGTRATHNWMNPGHTFVSIEQTVNGQVIRRSLGFYPGQSVDPFANPSTASALVDNSTHEYNVNISVNATPTQLQNVLSIISNFRAVYNLNTYNCTNFGIDIANAIGLNVPSTKGSWPNGGGCNPGDFGEDIRKLPGASGISANAPLNTGSCN